MCNWQRLSSENTVYASFILSTVGLPFFILTPQHSPFKRGFFCNDESIRYPIKEDTISYQLLGGVMIPFTLIVVSLSSLKVTAETSLTALRLISCLPAFISSSLRLFVASAFLFTYLASRTSLWGKSTFPVCTKQWAAMCLELLPASL